MFKKERCTKKMEVKGHNKKSVQKLDDFLMLNLRKDLKDVLKNSPLLVHSPHDDSRQQMVYC